MTHMHRREHGTKEAKALLGVFLGDVVLRFLPYSPQAHHDEQTSGRSDRMAGTPIADRGGQAKCRRHNQQCSDCMQDRYRYNTIGNRTIMDNRVAHASIAAIPNREEAFRNRSFAHAAGEALLPYGQAIPYRERISRARRVKSESAGALYVFVVASPFAESRFPLFCTML